MAICSNTTRRAPATSRRCGSCPRTQIAVLGLISTKVPELESKEELKRRVDEAARVIDLDRLGLSPQCGFATLYRYDRMGVELQERKLQLLGLRRSRNLGLAARAVHSATASTTVHPGKETPKGQPVQFREGMARRFSDRRRRA